MKIQINKKIQWLAAGALTGVAVLLVMGADVTTKMFDQTYFSTNQTAISLHGNITNWSKVSTNLTSFNGITNTLGVTPTGLALMQATPTTSLTISNLNANTLITPPVAWTQTTTNLVLDLGAGGWQTNTATADVHVTCSNIAAGRIVTLDIWAGTTNRNLSFDTPLTNWFSAVPSVISSNHIVRLSFMPPDDQTNHITLAAAQSFP